MSCRICSGEPCETTCRRCMEVRKMVEQHRGPKSLLLCVDGSVDMQNKSKLGRPAGIGMVLAESHDRILATAAVPLYCGTSAQAELTAIIRASQWAPGVTIWSDVPLDNWPVSKRLILEQLPSPVRHIHEVLRAPLHNTAHHLANAARLRDECRLTTLKVNGDQHSRNRRRVLGTNVVEYAW